MIIDKFIKEARKRNSLFWSILLFPLIFVVYIITVVLYFFYEKLDWFLYSKVSGVLDTFEATFSDGWDEDDY